MGVCLFTMWRDTMCDSGFRRPWLDLYTGSGLLAQRISSSASLSSMDEEENTGGGLPIELWVHIGKCFELHDFRAVVALGGTCHLLRTLSRHTEVWHHFCKLAYCLPGYLSCESVLRLYRFSYREMFRWRRRLRFDGLYYLTTTKLLHGLNEGRGMKELDKDFYNPGGRWVTSFRVFRFFPNGRMFSLLISSQTPGEVRKSASLVAAERPHTLHQKLGPAACWGDFDLRELEAGSVVAGAAHDAAADAEAGGHAQFAPGLVQPAAAPASCAPGASGKILLTAAVLLKHLQYPNMAPTVVRYVLELRDAAPPEATRGQPTGRPRGGATNADLHLTAHAIESANGGGMESVAIKQSGFKFLAFDGPLPETPFRPVAPSVQY